MIVIEFKLGTGDSPIFFTIEEEDPEIAVDKLRRVVRAMVEKPVNPSDPDDLN